VAELGSEMVTDGADDLWLRSYSGMDRDARLVVDSQSDGPLV
jgi:hypothetical protein